MLITPKDLNIKNCLSSLNLSSQGSGLELSYKYNTDSSKKTQPRQSGQKPGLGFPIYRIVAVTCLSTGAVLNAAMGNFNGKGGCEQTLLRTLLDTFESGDMMLGDGFYGTYFLLAELQSRKVNALFEQ